MNGRALLRSLPPLLMAIVLGLTACGYRQAAAPIQPAQVRPVPGTSLHVVTLTAQAMADIGVVTRPVRSAWSGAAATPSGAPRPSLTVVPLAAVIYDPEGQPWTYAIVGPRAFVRRAIVIARIDGDEVLLRSGPPAGTPVVTVGAPELLGAEYGVGEE